MHGNIHTLKFQYTTLETRKYDTETDKGNYLSHDKRVIVVPLLHKCKIFYFSVEPDSEEVTSKSIDSNDPSQIATLRWADVGLRAFGSLARRRNPTLAHRNVAHWRHVGLTVGLQPYANPIPPLSNVDPTSVKTIYNHVPT
jgi:hypothetical protein